jgi:hypothetical protein
MSADEVDVFVVLGDEGVSAESRTLHGIAHMIREQNRHNRKVEEALMGIQDDVTALAERMTTGLDTIEQKLGQVAETVDLSPLTAVADRVDALAVGDETTAPPTATNTSEVQPLYLVDGDANTDPSQWTPAAFTSVPDGRPLFTYVGDATAPGSPATGDGVGGVWHVYVGDLTPTS